MVAIETRDRRFFVRLGACLVVLVPSMLLAANVSLWWLLLVVAAGVGVFFSV